MWQPTGKMYVFIIDITEECTQYRDLLLTPSHHYTRSNLLSN